MDDKAEPANPPPRVQRLQWILFSIAFIGGLVLPAIPLYLIPSLPFPLSKWQPVANPPEPTSHLAGYNGFSGDIYIATKSGHIYDCSAIIDPDTVAPGAIQVCQMSKGSIQCGDATEEELPSFYECQLLEDPSRLTPLSTPGHDCGNRVLYPTPQPPGVIVENYHACYPWVDYQDFVQQHIIQLEDGTTWEWSQAGFIDGWPSILIYASCLSGTAGSLVGLVLMSIVWLLWRIRFIR